MAKISFTLVSKLVSIIKSSILLYIVWLEQSRLNFHVYLVFAAPICWCSSFVAGKTTVLIQFPIARRHLPRRALNTNIPLICASDHASQKQNIPNNIFHFTSISIHPSPSFTLHPTPSSMPTSVSQEKPRKRAKPISKKWPAESDAPDESCRPKSRPS